MALRPYVYGVELVKLRALFGSGKAGVIKSTLAFIERSYPADAAKIRDDCQAIARRAIREGAPFPDLKIEKEVHAVAIVALAENLSGRYRPDSDDNEWRISVVGDMLEEVPFRGATKKYLSYLRNGRPFLGNKVRSEWSYYSYLSLAEITDLADNIRAMQRKYPEMADPDFF